MTPQSLSAGQQKVGTGTVKLASIPCKVAPVKPQVLRAKRALSPVLVSLLVVLSLVVGGIGGGFFFVRVLKVLPDPKTVVDEKTVWEDRGAENGRIHELIAAGEGDHVVAFWAKYTKSTYNAHVILNAALLKGIPACMWFAQVKIENPSFDPGAVGGPNRNGSYDLGMGQGNENTFLFSGYFPGATRSKMLTVEYNMDILSTFFLDIYNGVDPKTKKRLSSAGSWDEALFTYNTGPLIDNDSRVPYSSVRRLMLIYEWERIFQRAFWQEFSR